MDKSCMKYCRFVKSIKHMGKMYSGRLWIWKRHMIRSLLADAKSVYGVGEKLLTAVQSSYIDSIACVPVGNDVSEWFPVNVGYRQGCVISPWLFNVQYIWMVWFER